MELLNIVKKTAFFPFFDFGCGSFFHPLAISLLVRASIIFWTEITGSVRKKTGFGLVILFF